MLFDYLINNIIIYINIVLILNEIPNNYNQKIPIIFLVYSLL